MIAVRNMTADDRDAVLSLHRESIFGLCKDHYTDREMKAWTERLTPELFAEGMKDENNVGILSVAADTVVAYGFINVRGGVLRALYVLPGYTGRGVGRSTLSRLEDMAREKGVDRLSLQATMNAVGFYERSGYRLIRAEQHRINDQISLACVCMEKALNAKQFKKGGV